MDPEALRPRGTVEVQCHHEDCGYAWWVDPTHPGLLEPDYEWNCGADHMTSFKIVQAFSRIRIETGFSLSCMQGLGLSDTKGDQALGKGWCLMQDREQSREGYFEWDSPQELLDTQGVLSRVEWDSSQWPSWTEGWGQKPSHTKLGWVSWIGYQLDNAFVRKATYVPCSRCKHDVMVDLKDPKMDLKGKVISIGSWNRGESPEPYWWGKVPVYCEEGLNQQGPQPCKLIHSRVLKDLEASTYLGWTMWQRISNTSGVALFYSSKTKSFGVLHYSDLLPFTSVQTLTNAIQMLPLVEIRDLLEDVLGRVYTEVLVELDLNCVEPEPLN